MSVHTVAAPAPDLHSPFVEAQELLSRVIAGDEQAWNEVVDRYAGLVWSVALVGAARPGDEPLDPVAAAFVVIGA